MSRYLISTCETYRVANEEEAKQLIEEAKQDRTYELAKYSSVQKEHKTKGEVDDTWSKVTLTKVFNAEREPEREVIVSYEC